MSVLSKSIVLFLFVSSFSAATSQSVTYAELDAIIANPERGFYHHTEVHSGNYSHLNMETLKGYRENESITQILRVFYLEDFREEPISNDYLDNMRKDFATVREAGVKAIVRFAYSQGTTAPYNDATPEIVQVHLNQLEPVLRENSDVIAVMQAGFIGTWGEWYYTDHFANSPGQVNEEDWENRRQVVYSILEALPNDRMVQIRTPGYKMRIFDNQEPINEQNAFSGSLLSRVGHHNDCFVASSSDFGTYVNPSIEKPYLEQETYFTPMGGETCALAPPYSDCDNSLSELERFHWSYLNIDYNKQVLNEWDNQGCFDEVELKLGYRFKMIDGTFTATTKPGGVFNFELNLQNDGYSNPYNPRLIEIILKHEETGEEYFFAPDENIRLWPLGQPFTIAFEAGIPESITEGNFDLYLNLPDPYPSLYENPAYAIRMANQDTWDEVSGYNKLNQSISIQSTNSTNSYTGESFFSSKTAQNTIEIDGSDKIFGGANKNAALVYWGRQNPAFQRVIERSVDGVNFETYASIRADLDYYLDLNVSENTSYTYRYYLNEGQNRSENSSSIELYTSGNIYSPIAIDANDTDWGAIPPISSDISLADVKSLRVFFGAQKANFLLQGQITDYQLYINTDNDISTGLQEAESFLQGMDYLLNTTELLKFNAGEWAHTGENIEKAIAGQTIELSLDLGAFQNLKESRILPIYGTLNSGEAIFQAQDGEPTTLYRELPPDTPENLQVQNSGQLPETRLVVSWSACNNCLEYILERSTDGENFDLVGIYEPTTTLIRDDNLTNKTTYYYRISSYNALGQSVFSITVSATTGVVPLDLDANTFSTFPNPTNGTLIIGENYDSFELYSVNGELLMQNTNQHSNRINVAHLKNGMYLIKLFFKGKATSLKFIKK